MQNNHVISAVESLASSCVKTAMDMKCPFIIVFSSSGYMASLVAKYMPGQPGTRYMSCLFFKFSDPYTHISTVVICSCGSH